MSKQKISYDLDLVIGGNLTEIEQKLHGLKNGLSSILDSKDAPKGLTRQFEQISAMMDRIRDKTSSPITSASGFKSLGKDIEKLELSFNGLVREINKIDDLPDEVKIQIFPPEEQKRLSTAIESLKLYEQSLENISKKKKELDTAQRAQAKAGKDKTSADRNVSYTKERIATKSGKKKELEAKLIGITDQDSERAKSYRAQIANLEQELTDLNSILQEQEQIQRNANSAYEQASTKVSQLQGGLDGLQGNSLKELRDKAKELGISFRKTKDETPEQAMARLAEKIKAVLAGGLEKIPEELNDLTVEARETQTEVRRMGDAVGEAGDEFDNMSKTASAGDAFAGRIKQMLGIQGAARLMRAALRDAIQTITELDKTMTEMAVVTDLGVGDYWDQLPEYSKRATDLGVSINSAYEAATLFYQQGLKTNEVVAISTETLKMARVAGLEAEEATNKMTAALRGFNMELNETSAQKVSDVYSQLAAITASDVEEISTAMTKTASIASSAGMEFETTAAFLSQIIETTRESAETAGTAMKTVIARFQELKKAPDEIGEVDGEIVNANQIEGALRTVGVSLRDASGQFRDLDEVFLELASKWDGLDKNTQRYIATIAAGSRQQSRFLAMMSDYNRTQELVSEANNSAGASNRQFEKTLESLEAKMEQLKNAWHEFTMGIMNSDLVKAGVDLATKFLNIINSITSGVLGVGDSFTKLISLVAMFKLGIAVFEMIRPKIIAFLASVAEEFKAYGQQAGKNWAEGTGEGVQGNQSGDTQTKKRLTKREQKKVQKTAKKKLKVAKKAAKKDPSEENIKNLQKAEEEYAKTSPGRWKNVSTAMNNAGMALMGVSMTLNMVSSALADAGLDGAAKTFEEISKWAMMAGSAFMALGTVMNIIRPLIKKTGDTGAEAGVKASAAWGPYLIIFLAIAAIAATIIAVCLIIAKQSPEAKLKEATKAAEDATNATNAAKEAYDQLGDSLDNLGNKYKSLEDLRKGTEEWNEAVREINNSVLDLIQEYPELANLVTRENGVLKLDVNSDEVQAVLNQYKAKEISAKGAELGAKIARQEAQDAVDFSKLGAADAVANKRGWETSGQWMVLNAIPVVGTIAGLIGSSIAGPIAAANTKSDKNLQDAVEALSLEFNKKKGDMSSTEMKDFLVGKGVLDDEAAIMAEEFAKDTDALMDFGQAIESSNAQQEAYYAAMATNAQAMIDLGKYTETQVEQMSNTVDEDLLKTFQDQETARLQKIQEADGSDDGEFLDAKEKFVKENYGKNYRVDGDKILNEAGEVVREFADSEAWIKEMSAAEATMRAAKMMEAVPDIIAKGITHLIGNDTAKNDLFNRAMKGAGYLSQNDLANYEAMIGDQLKLDAMWADLDEKTKEALGWDKNDLSSEEKAKEEYLKILKEPLETGKENFELANATAKKIGLNLEGKLRDLSSGAATGLVNKLKELAPTIDAGEMDTFETALAELLKGVSMEKSDEFMSALNSIDMMDINAWESLESAAREAGLDLEKFDDLKDAGADAANAIEKIKFDKFAEGINDTYKLLEKIKQGGRIYSEEDYKALIGANKDLKKSFVKIGDEFHYVGGTMDELIDALEDNTLNNIAIANRQLKAQTDMVEAMHKVRPSKGDPNHMDEQELIDYLMTMRTATMATGHNLSEFGIAGLADDTVFSALSVEELKRMASALAELNLVTFQEDYADAVRAGNIERYSHNTSLFNAQQAADSTSEFSDQHAQALIVQANRSGGVSDELIDSYQKLVDKENKDANDWNEIKDIGIKISNQVDDILEENAGRDAFNSLVDQVTEAIVALRQSEIDKLSEINESVNSANEMLLNKIQEQIDAERQARENAETQKGIDDMRSRLAYLGADTSGVNDLATLDLQEELKQAEQDYRDSQIDRAIEQLQDANEKAAEQREEQINLLQSQLDNDEKLGIIAEHATQVVSNSLEAFNTGTQASLTKMGELLTAAAMYEYMTEEQQNAFKSDLGKDTALANKYFTAKENPNLSGDGEDDEGQSAAIGKAKQAIAAGNQSLYQEALNDYKAASGSKSGWEEEFKDKVNDIATGRRSTAVDSINTTGDADQQDLDFVKNYSDFIGDGSFYDPITQAKNSWNQPPPPPPPPPKPEVVTLKSGDGFSAGMASWNWQGGDVSNRGAHFTFNGVDYWVEWEAYDGGGVSNDIKSKLNGATKTGNGSGHFGIYKDKLYWHSGVDWYPVYTQKSQWVRDQVADNGAAVFQRIKELTGYKTGGLADFTGPAWLDGTKSKPEIILNQKDSANFIVLKDILSEVLEGTSGLSKSKDDKGGDNYFDIDIAVENIEDDYSVEELANKIRNMIYQDATYRNVNTINLIR